MLIRTKNLKYDLLSVLFIIFVFIITLIRIFYGIEFTDESWHIAEPYAVANMGSVPFINNVTQSPAFTVPLFISFKIFTFLNNGTEGIVLFSRILFISVSLAVSIITYLIIVKSSNIKIPIIFIAFQFLYSCAGTIFTLNYNTIGLIYLPLVYALLFTNKDCHETFVGIRCIISSILAIRIIFATPQVIIGFLIVFVYLIVDRKYTHVKYILSTFVLAFLITVTYLIIKFGYFRLFNWFYLYFNQGYFKIAKRYSYKTMLLNFMYIFLPFIISLTIFELCKFKKNIIKFTYVLIVFIVGAVLSLKWVYADQFILNISLWYFPYLFFLCCCNYSKLNKTLVLIGVSYFIIFLFSSITNIYGFGGRYYWLSINILLFSIMIYNHNFNFEYCNNIKKIFVIIMIFISCLIKIINNYQYVYRDERIQLLNCRVDYGIWKGLYTSTERSSSILELEKFIFNNTDESDEILILDWASFGYIMCKGKICSPTTLDILHTYNVNDDKPLIDYFNIENRFPTKIIYIDYGRDSCLSVEDDSWKFNRFVNNNHSMSVKFDNKIFKCKIFEINY